MDNPFNDPPLPKRPLHPDIVRWQDKIVEGMKENTERLKHMTASQILRQFRKNTSQK
jgi:hypothetical protein